MGNGVSLTFDYALCNSHYLTFHHLTKIIEVISHGKDTSKRSKRSPNGTRKEQVTLSKLEKSVRDLATAGHDYLRMYIATENAFPDSTAKAAFSWKRLEDAVSSNVELKALKDDALKVEKTKEMLIDYVPSPSSLFNHFTHPIFRCGRASLQ
jgi:hypothetical protein